IHWEAADEDFAVGLNGQATNCAVGNSGGETWVQRTVRVVANGTADKDLAKGGRVGTDQDFSVRLYGDGIHDARRWSESIGKRQIHRESGDRARDAAELVRNNDKVGASVISLHIWQDQGRSIDVCQERAIFEPLIG